MAYPDDLVSTIEVVSLKDAALDWAAMNAAGMTPRLYAETRDPSSLRELPGACARRFVLRPLSVSDMAFIDSNDHESVRMIQAFRTSVTEIRGWMSRGEALRGTVPVPTPGGSHRMIWGDDDLQKVADGVGMRTIYEIGRIAYERAAEGNGRSGSAIYTLPLFLVPELDRIERHLAALFRSTDGTLSNGPSANE